MGRVFTPGERRQIRESDDPERTLWSLWAGKETAYKAIRRGFPAVTSAPGRYQVAVSSHVHSLPKSGFVSTPCGTVFVDFSCTDEYVHCIGATDHGMICKIMWDVREIPRNAFACDGESDSVRHMAKQDLSTRLVTDPEAIEIIRPKDDYGLAPPMVQIEGRTLPVILSMSHDGRFAACAFTIPPPPEHHH